MIIHRSVTFFKNIEVILKNTITTIRLSKNFQVPFRKFSDHCQAEIGQNQLRGLVLGVWEKEDSNEPKLTSATEKFDQRIGGKLSELIREFHITGQVGKGKIFSNLCTEFKQVAVVGAGKESLGYNELEMIYEGRENVRVAAGIGARKLQEQGCNMIAIDAMDNAEAAATGALLGVFTYQDNKMKKDRLPVAQIELYESPDTDSWVRGCYAAEAQNLARKLSDTPANQMTPTCFAQACVEALCPCGINVEVRTMEWIETHRLNSFLTVARSSCEPPVFLEISYCGAPLDVKPILLIGMGLTYNSGGICLKSKEELIEARGQMAGAAVIISTIRAAASLSLPVNLNALIPLCENMPSGMAVRPGDVITCLNGKTLAIEDTASAGSVILADTLVYGQTMYKPKITIDVATINYGISSALGGGAAGVYSSSHYLWQELQKAGALSGDRLWRMPLWNYYKKKVTENPSFDITNRGKSPAISCLAAAMLREFIPCADWAHIDIQGVGMTSKCNSISYLRAGRMTGRPTRTLIQFLYQQGCPEAQNSIEK